LNFMRIWRFTEVASTRSVVEGGDGPALAKRTKRPISVTIPPKP
jgi:hypothetical protein